MIMPIRSLDALDDFAQSVSRVVGQGAILLLTGELGAGKTTFVRALARHLGVTDNVTSPTFTLIQHYKGQVPMIHMDLYRLDTLADIQALDPDRYFSRPNTLICIEWAEKLGELCPSDGVTLSFEFADSDARNITITGDSPVAKKMIQIDCL